MSDVPIPLLFVEDPPAPEQINVLLYGPTGSGKSTAAATAPGPILWVNAEGPNALAYARKTARQNDTRILEVRLAKNVDPRPQMRQVIEYVRSDEEPRPRTVVVDTLGKLRELLIAQIVVPGAKNTMQQFGEVAKTLNGFLQILRDEPVNVVLIAHEDIDSADGERIIRPLIGGVLTEQIPSDVDVMAYCGVVRDEDGVRYVGQLVEGRGRRAKDRSGGLGQIRDLDLSEWLDAFRAALGGDDLPWDDGFDGDTLPEDPGEPDAEDDDAQLEIEAEA